MDWRKFLTGEITFRRRPAAAEPVASGNEAATTSSDMEKNIQAMVEAEVLGKLTLKESKKEVVSTALSDMIRLASAFLRRSPNMQLENSTTFGSRREAFNQALLHAGVKEDDVATASAAALTMITEQLRAQIPVAPPPQVREEERPPQPRPKTNDDPEALTISDDQVKQAVAMAMEAGATLQLPDDAARQRLESALAELAESRAVMLRIAPAKAVERYDAAEASQGKQNAAMAVLKELNPGQPHANAELLHKMLGAMDNAMGWVR